jgi:glycerol transport system ATP-binding protein
VSLELDQVGLTVRDAVHIHPLSLTLAPGTLNVLLGPTLSGKTTLMRLMAGLDVPTTGRIRFNGQDVTGVPVRQRNVAMVYQQFINYPAFTVYDNIASPLRVQGMARAEIDKKVQSAAALMRLEPYLKRTPLELSGGQQQRTAIARALVKGADLVLMDEPLANLDYKLREELRAELPRIFEESGTIFVYATTEPSEALLLGGNTATLHHGRVTQFGKTTEVYRQPHDLMTAAVFSDPPMNLAQVAIRAGVAALNHGATIPVRGVADGSYTIGLRPHHVHLNAAPGLVPVPAIVGISEITGSESYIHVDAGGSRWIALEKGVVDIPPGTAIDVFVDPSRLFVFAESGALMRAPQSAIAVEA